MPTPTGPIPDTATTDEAEFYAGLTTRNAGVVDRATQDALRTARVLVAGCGSIGGAAVEPLARLGVRTFRLADPGEYELNNLNRQNATAADLGRNKAEVAADRVRAINPYARVTAYPDGVTGESVAELTGDVDVIVDGVDVTTMSGLRAKYLLHQHALARRLPLLTGWDMAGAQYVRCYDYRRLRRPFDGRLTEADLDRLDMWQILQRLVPARYVPLEMLTIARAALTDPDFSFPQLVYAADLFGVLATYVVSRFLVGRPVREHIYVDVQQTARPAGARGVATLRRPYEAVRLLTRVRNGDR
jgi:molybdopterin-synthase adenylyltransferase